MPRQFLRKFRKSFSQRYRDINPEDIFLDSANLPALERERFEGRIERPIGERTFFAFKIVFVLIAIFLAFKLGNLDIVHGQAYAETSENNHLDRTILFADRGTISDRNGVLLAANGEKASTTAYSTRVYASMEGLASVLGYVKYPSADANGNYYDENYQGLAGIEKSYDAELAGTNGSKLIETDAKGNTVSEGVIDTPKAGTNLTLALDANVTQELYKTIASVAADRGFSGGAGVIMDIHTGEILALTSFPEFDPNVITDGSDKEEISHLFADPSNPFLNRAVSGLYTPGSIVKPIVATGALTEGVIDDKTTIFSSGSISVPNPYDPKHPSIFNDWQPNGLMTVRDAIARSSDVFFYEVGGGFQNQPGLGITKLDNYFTQFGLTEKTGIDLPAENVGYIATPAWKAENFPDDPDWRLGDTYHTAIGQYGTQVTPLEAVRWVATIANGGTMLVPQVVYDGSPKVFRTLNLPQDNFEIVREGMREGVAGGGVAAGLNTPSVEVAAKTGTAELGTKKLYVNSWVTGFFPYQNPRYAFAVIMEKGPETNTIGGVFVMRQVLDWMAENSPDYLK
jgi:penicillin-binding protein 2